MANQGANPLAAPLTTLKQIGEQANQSIQQLGTGFARSVSQGLDSLIQGVPPIPGVPGAGVPTGGLPSPQKLLPANLRQALTQVENLMIPPGLPKPSSLMGGTATPPPATPPAEEQPPAPEPSAAQAVTGRRRITELGGY